MWHGATTRQAGAARDMVLPRLDVLYEASGLPALDLPASLAEAYGGSLGFAGPQVCANFVATVDGVVAIPSVPSSNKLIAAGSASDRFVMGLLRACADVLMIGSGTLAASPRSLWTPDQAYPDAAAAFAELRSTIGKPPRPELAILSGRGLVDAGHPLFAAGAVVLTTDTGAARLHGTLPAASEVISLGAGDELDPRKIVAALEARGHRLILSEGGSHSLAPLLAAGAVDELFLTVSPLLVGRTPADPRLGLVEGADLLSGGPLEAELIGVRRDGDHLFLRYRLGRSGGDRLPS